MNNLNSVLIEGNVVQEPVYKTSPKGKPLCTFSLASYRYYCYENRTVTEINFFDIETWSKLAEYCQQGHKGYGVRVVGRLKQERWNDAGGKTHSKIIIVAEHVEFKPDRQEGSVPRAERAEALVAGTAQAGLF
ncbi:MAG: single-stranded DNA-binding protein [Spirochaetaceae bacterium]|nr:single-stranded DNA-binding protein [Spirochaetaceae bacterium]